MPRLSPDEVAAFHTDGYIIIERFFDEEECCLYKADIDTLEFRRSQGERIGQPLEFPHLGPLICHPRVMETVESLMGPHFLFHHL